MPTHARSKLPWPCVRNVAAHSDERQRDRLARACDSRVGAEQEAPALRALHVEEAWSIAAQHFERFGVTRVTDITRLDRVGLPVYAAIRPGARPDSLCVHAGKGLTRAEARIGAFMEAVEFACAEFDPAAHPIHAQTFESMLGELAIGPFDFPPQHGVTVYPSDVIDCFAARDIDSGAEVLVPAELVFLPYRSPKPRLFGPTSAGLAVGWTHAETALHGIAEIMERDVESFSHLGRPSRRVSLAGYSGPSRPLLEAIAAAGLDVIVTYTENEYDLPYLSALVVEPDIAAPIALARGFGFHLSREIALERALTEALQSRLSWIHGGRDDFTDRIAYFERHGGELEARQEVLRRARAGAIDWADVPDAAASCTDPPSAVAALLARVRAAGITRVFRVDLGRSGFPFCVHKYIAPGLEVFEPNAKRVGLRLLQAVGLS